MLEFIQQPWPWYVSGTMIAVIMFTLIYFGKTFGFSSNLRTICAVGGGGKYVKFFDMDWRSQVWNLIFLIGAVIGGLIASQFLADGNPVAISSATITDLAEFGIGAPESIQPTELYSMEALFTLKGFLILAFGGLMVGFGSRYAGGCTSGHAITGISTLQMPSLIAVVGFFAGGLLMTYILMPIIL